MTVNKHRVQQIRELPEARERPFLADAIAMRTTCSLSEAQQILRAAPLEQAACRPDDAQDDVIKSLQSLGVIGQAPAADTDDGASDSVRQLIRAVGLKGFKQAND